MKLLVSGCSMTHGAELYNGFMHPNNVKLSYSQHVADALGVENLNVAMSAGSNEYIFHSLMENILNHDDIHSVIAMWTTTGRKYWKCNGRHYSLVGNSALSMVDLVNFKRHDKGTNGPNIVGDSAEIVDVLEKHIPFFVTNYYDHNEELKKLNHYQESLKSLCKLKNIKLINLDWTSYPSFVNLMMTGKHPTADKHKELAKHILSNYYDIKI